MGAPAGAGGSGTGPNANVFLPGAQSTADNWLTNILGITPGNTANVVSLANLAQNYGETPAGASYTAALPQVSNNIINNPGLGTAISGANAGVPLGYAGANAALAGIPALSGAAGSILNTAFDPQQALYNQTLGQVQQQTAAGLAGSGVLNTPYGQQVAGNTDANFNLNWQNNLLGREATGLSAAAGGYGAAEGLAGSGLQNLSAATNAPYNVYNTQGTNALNAESSLANLGQAQFQVPQQVIQDLESYLGLGQSASTISGQLGQMGQNELATSLAGVGGAASLGNSLLGNPLGTAGTAVTSGIGNLIGSTGSTVGSIGGAAATPAAIAADTSDAAIDVGGGGSGFLSAIPSIAGSAGT